MKDDGEQQIRQWLRSKIDGPTEPKPEPTPFVQVHVVPEPTAAPTEEDQDDDEEEPEKDRPWWYTLPGPFGTRPAPAAEPTQQETFAAAPGIHVTVNQPTPQAPYAPPVDRATEERLHRRRLWVAYHAGAAGVGWFFGLPQLLGEAIASTGHQGAPLGIGFCLVGYLFASYLPGLPYVPPPLRPVIVWAARIPICSAALALALYAPGTL